jgi:4-diphosphocytidyl-2-C-methyl-D-erythritol kinase
VKNWPAPAKLNLFLHITGQRQNGYHELQTVFQFVDYADNLQFEVHAESEIQLSPAIEGVANEDNLIVRAAKLLQNETHTMQGAHIYLEKRLPMGGGLGGGSSNAATTLIALNELWGCGLSMHDLAQLGLQLGADVPVFIHGHATWAEGVGEKFTPIDLDEPWFVVVSPDCHVSTAEIFSAPELTRDCKAITISRFLSGEGRNVCEDVVRARYPEVAEVLDWLSQFSMPRMTGTGASVFAKFDNEHLAQQVLDKMPEKWLAFIAKGCNISPLTTAMKASN